MSWETYKEDPEYSLHREGTERLPCVFPRLFIKRWIHIVNILLPELFLSQPQAFTEFSNLSKCPVALYLQGLQGDFIFAEKGNREHMFFRNIRRSISRTRRENTFIQSISRFFQFVLHSRAVVMLCSPILYNFGHSVISVRIFEQVFQMLDN